MPRALLGLLALLLTASGMAGAFQYGWTFWLYRGFAAPSVPGHIPLGTVQQFDLASQALGGRSELVYVFLPPDYARAIKLRYPTLYLLHGTPGAPLNFIQIGDMGAIEDRLIAERRMHPMVLVMPAGGSGYFADTEWANSIHPGNNWETWVARDVVDAIDHRFRVAAAAGSRAIAGLSEGGYGALNIGLHHLSEFHLIESWSGYMTADNIASIFGRRTSRLRYNSPDVMVRRLRDVILRDGTYIWLYSGRSDPLLGGNRSFAAELVRLRIPHEFLIEPGSHNWRLWRSMATSALLVASEHLSSISIAVKAQ